MGTQTDATLFVVQQEKHLEMYYNVPILQSRQYGQNNY